MQRQIRGHIVQGLMGHQHRLALEVQLGIDHPRQLEMKQRRWRGVFPRRRCSRRRGRWAGGATQGLQVTHIQVAREQLCPHQGPLLLPLQEDVPPQIACPQGSGEPPHCPAVPFLRQMARELRRLLARAACPWSDGCSEATRVRDTSAATPCSCKGWAMVPCRSTCHGGVIKLHLQGEWPIGAEVLECTGGQGELQRRAGKLPHTFNFQPLLSIHRRCMHLGKRCSNLCMARVIPVGDTSLTQVHLANAWQRKRCGSVLRWAIRPKGPVRLPLLGGLQSEDGLDQLDGGEDNTPPQQLAQVKAEQPGAGAVSMEGSGLQEAFAMRMWSIRTRGDHDSCTSRSPSITTVRPSALLASRSTKPLIQFQSKTSTRTTIPTINSARAMPIHFITVCIFDLYAAHIVRDSLTLRENNGGDKARAPASIARRPCPALSPSRVLTAVSSRCWRRCEGLDPGGPFVPSNGCARL